MFYILLAGRFSIKYYVHVTVIVCYFLPLRSGSPSPSGSSIMRIRISVVEPFHFVPAPAIKMAALALYSTICCCKKSFEKFHFLPGLVFFTKKVRVLCFALPGLQNFVYFFPLNTDPSWSRSCPFFHVTGFTTVLRIRIRI